MHDLKNIHRKSISDQLVLLHGKWIQNVCSVANVSKVKTLGAREKSPTQKAIAESLNISVAIINKIITLRFKA